MKVAIAGGGTAGHVLPALALARALDNDEVMFLGTRSGAEASLVPDAGRPLGTIDVRGFDRARPSSLPATGGRALKAIAQARAILKRFGPDVVVGMGGYVALPSCLAARTLRIPVVLHEQNIVFGLANRVCRRFAAAIAVSFEETLAHAGPSAVLTGNPVRVEMTHFDKPEARAEGLERFRLDPARSTLLIFGGSQGAQRVNRAGIGLTSLWAERNDVQILHIAGRVEAATFIEQAEQILGAGEKALVYRVEGYLQDMIPAYGVADLVLCRGGAGTVAELTAVGLPSIIVPYPYHRDMQQERHGRVLERAGAAVVLNDEEATAERVAKEVESLLGNRSVLESMGSAARSIGRPDAADHLAAVVRRSARRNA